MGEKENMFSLNKKKLWKVKNAFLIKALKMETII